MKPFAYLQFIFLAMVLGVPLQSCVADAASPATAAQAGGSWCLNLNVLPRER